MKQTWRDAIPSEVGFWREWLTTGGSIWPSDFRWRMDPASTFQAHLAQWVEGRGLSVVRVLDVGSGPLTGVGKVHPDFAVEITPIDALADEYAEVLAELEIVPLVPTIRCEAEELLKRFGPGVFDVVYACNSLDHCWDPVGALRQMVIVTAPEGVVVLDHRRDEAERQEHLGMHQWNLSIDGGFHIAGVYPDLVDARIVQLSEHGDWDRVVLRKL